MTPAERAALLDLWNRVPECAPVNMGILGDGTCGMATHDGGRTRIPDADGAALACDAIERWLVGMTLNACMSLSPPFTTTFNRCGHDFAIDGESKLSALIAAALAVAGKGDGDAA